MRTLYRMDSAIDFKSLRAKFQEAQSTARPAVPHRPRRWVLPPGGATSSISSSGESTSTSTTPVAVIRDDHKVAPARRPISVPAGFFHHVSETGSGVTRVSLRDRPLPLVLPSACVQEKQPEKISSAKLVTSPIKCKKKAMPTPFRPNKFSKCIKDILEGAAEHVESSHAHRPPSQFSSASSLHNGFAHHNGGSTCVSPCPSPEQPGTPPPKPENTSNVLSTLEKAKKKFSPKNLLVYARPKSFTSSRSPPESPPPAGEYENVHHQGEAGAGGPPVKSHTSLFLQTNGLTHMTGGAVHVDGGETADGPPACRALPDLSSLGPAPSKPARPLTVDLSLYTHTCLPKTRPAVSSIKRVHAPVITAEDLRPEPPVMPAPPEFDAPEFPDFEASVLEALSSNLINLATLEMESTEFGTPPLPVNQEQVEDLEPQRSKEVMQKCAVCPVEGAGVPEHWTDSQSGINGPEVLKHVTSETSINGTYSLTTDFSSTELPSEPSFSQRGEVYEVCDNVYEEVETVTKFHFSQNSRKRKGHPKNPYADSPGREGSRKNVRAVTHWAGVTAETALNPAHCDRKERWSPDHPEDKELRKREKQRLERERKEQKEREKKENEMRKKFKITGQEEPMYHARVLVASKPRKHDLQVKSGDTVSIIRTTNCPRGKWLARDIQHTYGYISVMNVELNMKEMLELGKRAAGRAEADTLSLSSRSSHYNPVLTSSFTDDSEEWTGDDETSSAFTENMGPNRAISMPDMFGGSAGADQALSAGSLEDLPSQVNHEALQKLAVFFQNPREPEPEPDPLSIMFNGSGLSEVEEPPYVSDDQFSFADVDLLPPPELYADSV